MLAIYSDGTQPTKVDPSLLTFTSGNDTVATVSTSGLVSAAGVGTTNIEVKATTKPALSGYAVVTVTA